jgi:BASS family bile acid:Na+ symporter
MNAMALVLLAVKTSIFLTVLALGLRATPGDATYLLRHPGLLARSLVAMFLTVPLFAVAVASAFDLAPAVRVALVALSLSPVPPVLPRAQLQAGGRASYTVGLLVAAAVVAIVFVPVALAVIGALFGVDARMGPVAVGRIVLATILVPLGLGLAVRRFAPALADRLTPIASLVGTVLLIAGALPVLFAAWRLIVSLIGNGTVLAFVAFAAFGLMVGHLLGEPDPDDRTVLALSCAKRHPGMAIAIATANFAEHQLVLGAVLLYTLVAAVVAAPYVTWRKRRRALPAAAPATPG